MYQAVLANLPELWKQEQTTNGCSPQVFSNTPVSQLDVIAASRAAETNVAALQLKQDGARQVPQAQRAKGCADGEGLLDGFGDDIAFEVRFV